MSIEEWTEVSRMLNKGVIRLICAKDSEVFDLVKRLTPRSWKMRVETDEHLDRLVFLILGSYEYEPPGEERFQRRFVEMWLYNRRSSRLSCRRQVVTTYPDVNGGLKEVPSPEVFRDREEVDLRDEQAAAGKFMRILNQDIFRFKDERKVLTKKEPLLPGRSMGVSQPEILNQSRSVALVRGRVEADTTIIEFAKLSGACRHRKGEFCELCANECKPENCLLLVGSGKVRG
jgi:hypothetical protein